MTGSKRIEFETCHARVQLWLKQTLTKVEEQNKPQNFPSQNLKEAELKVILDGYRVLLGEIEENLDGMCKEAVSTGKELMERIKQEEDFPPDYLENVASKVEKVEEQMSKVAEGGRELRKRLDYLNGMKNCGGSKGFEFESCHSRVQPWLEKTLAKAEVWLKPESFPSQELNDVELNRLLDEYHVLLLEIEENLDGMCKAAVLIGKALMERIKAERDFPSNYLETVASKVKKVEEQMSKVAESGRKLRERLDYLKGKKKFYESLVTLRLKLTALQEWFDDQWEVEDYEDSEMDEIQETLIESSQKKKHISNYKSDLEIMKRLAGEVTSRSIRDDPDNSIKKDVFEFCDNWEKLEKELAQRESDLIKLKKRKTGDDSVSALDELSPLETELQSLLQSDELLLEEAQMHDVIKSIRNLLLKDKNEIQGESFIVIFLINFLALTLAKKWNHPPYPPFPSYGYNAPGLNSRCLCFFLANLIK